MEDENKQLEDASVLEGSNQKDEGSSENPYTVEKPEPAIPVQPKPAAKKPAPSSILTIDSNGEVETPESIEDTIWHDLKNAYRTRKILTGQLGGVERMEGGGTIAVVYYRKFRVAIPLSEMMIYLAEDEAHDYGELAQRQNKIIGNMLGCEIDFKFFCIRCHNSYCSSQHLSFSSNTPFIIL